VRTASDSTSTSSGLTQFRVIANMDEGNFQNVEEAWGYSVDNIAPEVPENLMASGDNDNLNISWSEPIDPDFAYHQIHNLYTETIYSAENEASIGFTESYNEFFVNSVDTNDNISENSNTVGAHSVHYGANLISLSVIADDNSVSGMISPDIITDIIAEGMASTYNPVLGWVGSMQTINPSQGVWVKSIDDNGILTTVGDKIEVTSFDLHYGANLISYTCSYPGSLDDLVDNENVISIIGEGTAATLNPVLGWVGSLTALQEGRGYWFKADEATQLSYDCPESYTDFSSRINITTTDEYVQSTEQAFYFFGGIDGVEYGDIITAYHGDTIVGSRAWFGPYTDVPAMGKDFQDETQDYCVAGTIPVFKLMKNNGEVLTLDGLFPSWSSNGIFIMEEVIASAELPNSYSLHSAYPNPFNPVTSVDFSLPENSLVKLAVYDIKGVEVANITNQYYDAGSHTIQWNASSYASGTYFIRMTSGEFNSIQKVVLLK